MKHKFTDPDENLYVHLPIVDENSSVRPIPKEDTSDLSKGQEGTPLLLEAVTESPCLSAGQGITKPQSLGVAQKNHLPSKAPRAENNEAEEAVRASPRCAAILEADDAAGGGDCKMDVRMKNPRKGRAVDPKRGRNKNRHRREGKKSHTLGKNSYYHLKMDINACLTFNINLT